MNRLQHRAQQAPVPALLTKSDSHRPKLHFQVREARSGHRSVLVRYDGKIDFDNMDMGKFRQVHIYADEGSFYTAIVYSKSLNIHHEPIFRHVGFRPNKSINAKIVKELFNIAALAA